MSENSHEARQYNLCTLHYSPRYCFCILGVIFTALPAPPEDDDGSMQYLNAMSTLSGVYACLFLNYARCFSLFLISANLPSMVLVHGVQHVVTTTF